MATLYAGAGELLVLLLARPHHLKGPALDHLVARHKLGLELTDRAEVTRN